jgi:hypothetical protein
MTADGSLGLSVAEATQAIRGIHAVEEGSFSVTPYYPENFLIECRSQAARDLILGATPLPASGTRLVLRPWTRLAHAEASTFKFKVSIELEGIPPHVWAEDTAAKILAPACWIHTVNPESRSKADLSAFKLVAWTCDPKAIPKVVWLHVAENEVVYVRDAANPIFGSLPPYLWRKHVLAIASWCISGASRILTRRILHHHRLRLSSTSATAGMTGIRSATTSPPAMGRASRDFVVTGERLTASSRLATSAAALPGAGPLRFECIALANSSRLIIRPPMM